MNNEPPPNEQSSEEREKVFEEKIKRLNDEADNYVRELEKSMNAFENLKKYLKAHSEMNAALHKAEEVIPSPLYSDVVMSMRGIRAVLRSWKRKVPKEKLD